MHNTRNAIEYIGGVFSSKGSLEIVETTNVDERCTKMIRRSDITTAKCRDVSVESPRICVDGPVISLGASVDADS